MEVQSSILCRNNFFAKIKQSLSVLLLLVIFLGVRRAIREPAQNCVFRYGGRPQPHRFRLAAARHRSSIVHKQLYICGPVEKSS